MSPTLPKLISAPSIELEQYIGDKAPIFCLNNTEY